MMDDDDDDDFRGLFFTECEELLADLQEHLGLLQAGEGEPDTLNAAFRAVHSVKGGAAAFGFDDLISFAHAFETVMDLARSDKIELTQPVCLLLLRSGDVMETLIEKARADDSSPTESMAKVLADLNEIASGSGRPVAETAPGSDAPAAEEKTEEAPAEEPAAKEEEPQAPVNEFVVEFKPDSGLFRAGHEPLKMIAAARAIGLTRVECTGNIPSITELSFDDCPLAWKLYFETSETRSKLEEFFLVYEAAAQFDIQGVGSDEAEAPVETAKAVEPEPAKESAPTKVAEPEPAPATEAKPAQAAPKSAPAGGASPAKQSKTASKSLRVDLARVDRLVNLVGEIVITQAALAQKLSESEQAFELEVGHSVEAMSRQTRELQESVMAIRAQPIKSVFSRMPRVVRDLADKLNKDAKLELSGEQTEVDTTVIEELAEPLTHMLRNSMDHGLETAEERVAAGKPATGTITLSAEHRGERVIITLQDDGRGINREVVHRKALEKGLVSKDDNLSPEEIDHLIFHPGFSTAEKLSSVSGRGVGMDVVKKKIQELGGRCSLKSVPGQGCIFTIGLPLTLAVLDGMTISVGDERYILPLSNVVEALRLDTIEVHELPDRSQVLSRRGEYLPLLSIRNVLRMQNTEQKKEEMAIIVDTETDGYVALLVDELIGQRQVVLKSLEANYRRVDGVSGATILGDGRVALILDVPNLVSLNQSQVAMFEEFTH